MTLPVAQPRHGRPCTKEKLKIPPESRKARLVVSAGIEG